MRWLLKLNENQKLEEAISVELVKVQNGSFFFEIRSQGKTKQIQLTNPKASSFGLKTDELDLHFESWTASRWRGSYQGQLVEVHPFDRDSTSSVDSDQVLTQMPGRILKVLVKAGEEVKASQPLFIMEAMKMENEIRSPRAGFIESLHAEAGASVEAGALLLKLKK